MDISVLTQELKDYYPVLIQHNDHSNVDCVRMLRKDGAPGGVTQLCIGQLGDFLTIGLPTFTCNFLIFCSEEEFLPYQAAFQKANCILFPLPPNPVELIDFILDLLEQDRRVVNSATLLSRSTSSALPGMDLRHIMDLTYDLLGNPFSICNTDGVLIDYQAIDQVTGPADMYFTHGEYVPIPQKFNEICQIVNCSQEPVIFETFADMNIRNVVSKITLGNEVVAYFLMLEHHRAILPSDLIVVKMACQWFAAELKKSKVFLTPKNSLISHFLSNLLNCSSHSAEELCTKIVELNYGKKAWNNLLVADCSAQPLSPFDFHSLRKSLEQCVPGGKVVVQHPYMSVHVNTDTYDFFTPTIRGILEDVARKYNIKLGLGYRYHNLVDTREAFEQGQAAINFGSHIHPDRRFYLYDDYALYHLLDQVNVSSGLRRHCHPKLLELIEYDRAHETPYTHTLFVLILTNNRQAEAAKRLHIHRSTMLYRIDKITEITGGLNLHDTRIVTRLFLSYSILVHTGELCSEEYSISRWADQANDDAISTLE